MADDFADDPSFEGERLAALDKWDELLEQAYRREVDHPVFRALRSTVRSFNIPIQLFKSLLTAYRMDLGLTQVLTYRELRGYCDRSASPIGRLALVIHGYWSPAQQRFSDDLCAGVQIANQLRNLRSDLAAGRCYLPLEDLMHFGVTREELAESTWTDGCRELIRFSASRTRTLLLRGQPLIRRVDADLGSELEVTWRGANAVLDQLGLQCSSETSQPNPAQGEPPVSSRFGFGALVGSLR
jgi:phytoene/squalene synthetase